MPDPYDAIHAALDLARYAPSSHNSQPWQVNICRPNANLTRAVVVQLDEVTRLRALETLDAEMAISLGTYVGVVCRALTLAGLVWTCEALPNETGVILRVGWGEGRGAGDLNDFRDLVKRRRTCRAPFRPDPLSIAQCLALQTRIWPPLGLGAAGRVEILSDHDQPRKVAQLVAHYGALDFSNYTVWSETYAHIHFCSADRLQEGRGFSIESLLGPMSRLKRFALRLLLHPISLQLFRLFGAPRRLAHALAELTTSSPGILVLTASQPKPSFADLIETGSRLSELWLCATGLGVQVHPLSVLLQHPDPRRSLQSELHLSATPLFIARIGVQVSATIKTPRIRLETILRQPECAARMSRPYTIGK